MSGEDNNPPANGGNETGHGGQGQPQGGQGGQQPQQGGQQPPQGGQQPPQGGQQPPQGGQQPQGGQYGGQQPRGGYGGPSATDQITNAITSPTGKGYLIVSALLSVVVGLSAAITLSLTSFLNGSLVSGPMIVGGIGVTGGSGAGFAISFGGVVLTMTAAAGLGVLLTQTLDDDMAGIAAVAGASSFVGAFLLSFFVSAGVVLNLPSGTSGSAAPGFGDAIVGAVLVGVGALIAGAGAAFVADRFDPHDQSARGGYQQAPQGGQPPQGGQGPR